MTTTLAQAHRYSACYYGNRPDWLILASQHRDSEYLDRSNFQVAQREAEAALGADNVAVERSSHWAVGWVEYVILRPSLAAQELLTDIKDRLEQYPILDEDDCSDEEYGESLSVIENCFIPDTLQNHWLYDGEALAPYIYGTFSDLGYSSEWADQMCGYPDMTDRDYRDALAAAIREWRRDRRQEANRG